MKKSKGQTVDLLYTNNKETNKKNKKNTKRNTKNSKNKSRNTISKQRKKTNKSKTNTDRINLDNEIIIGLTPKIKEPKKVEKKKSTKSKSNKKQNKKIYKNNNQNKKIKNKKNTIKRNSKKTKENKKKKNSKIIKWFVLIILIIFSTSMFMLSSIFNIKKIVVINNNKIPEETILNLSKLTPGTNMFKTTNRVIRNNLKENAYIEDVKVKRNINGTITLDIIERKPSYMIEFANTYVYINNQGYMLEITEEKLEIPIIVGISTPNEEVKEGNRLNVDDLNRLDNILKIIEAAKSTSLVDNIVKIDISNPTNYLLVIGDNKTVIIDDMSNINIKLQMAEQVMKNEEDKIGEIYFQEDGKKAIFKEEVSR